MGNKQLDKKSNIERHFKFVYDRLNQKVITARLRPPGRNKDEGEIESFENKQLVEARQLTNYELFEEKLPKLKNYIKIDEESTKAAVAYRKRFGTPNTWQETHICV